MIHWVNASALKDDNLRLILETYVVERELISERCPLTSHSWCACVHVCMCAHTLRDTLPMKEIYVIYK